MRTKSVVITGSARGLGYEMAKCFRKKNYNVVVSDVLKKDVDNAVANLLNEKGKGEVVGYVCDISLAKDVINLVNQTKKKLGVIDFWINNAGINQSDKHIWDMDDLEIARILDVDLKGTVLASKYAAIEMARQNSGAIYTVEGHGSNDAIIPKLSLYGTAKRGLTYFVKALALEMEKNKKDVIVGLLSPGIMITDFLTTSYNKKKTISEKDKRIYNILGDYPDVVANYLVRKMISNTNNGVRIKWLTGRKALFRFMTFWIRRKNYFDKEK